MNPEKGISVYDLMGVSLDQFIEVVRSIQEFWLTIVKLPTQ